MRARLAAAILPGWSTDDPGFWARFDAAAPAALRWGTRGIALLVVVVLPALRGTTWSRLDDAGRDALVRRAASSALLGAGVELVKLAACFAAFDDDAGQAGGGDERRGDGLMHVVDGASWRGQRSLLADVVVVGSGPGGAAAARAAAGRGARVVVLEEGPRLRPADFVASGFQAMARGYRGLGATLAWGAPPTPLLQGRMVGGGSPINGAICWRLPQDVWAGWVAADPGLADGLPWAAIEAATDAVEARLGVAPTDPAVAGPKNLLLARGAEALGLAHRPIRRNVTGCVGLGRCLQGCPEGRKASVDLTLLADAVADGAEVVSGARVIGVRVEGGRARGVDAVGAGGARIRVTAPVVVLAAGAVHTPALLLASGLRQGPVGLGFMGHPGVSMAGRFAEPVRSWEGATQGHEVVGLRAEGLKFEALGMDLSLLTARLPGVGRELAGHVEALDRWVDWGAAVRARARGRVRLVLGRPVVTWSPTAEDVATYRRGLVVLGELLFAAGAEAVAPGLRGGPSLVTDPRALAALLAAPWPASAMPSVITHLFGGACLGTDPARSVVGPDLRNHHVAGLYVADASVFPTNTGVNPQVGIMALGRIAGLNAGA